MKKLTNNLNWFKKDRLKPFTAKQRIYFLTTYADLLEEGFSTYQALDFMKLLMPKLELQIEQIEKTMMTGQPFEQAIQPFGFPISIVAQLFYGQRQGRFIETLNDVVKQQIQLEKYRKQLLQALLYPVFMSVFLVALLFGMRRFMLPQVISFMTEETFQKQPLARVLVHFFIYLPQGSLGLITICLISWLGFDFYFMRFSLMTRFNYLPKVKICRKWVQQYCSYRLMSMLGEFLGGGYSILQTLDILINYPIDPFLTEMAHDLNQALLTGASLDEIINERLIFTPELTAIIIQGEATSQFAIKCQVYSQKIYQEMLEQWIKKIKYIQPCLFIIIAVFVMAMYLLMMLPLLTMDGF